MTIAFIRHAESANNTGDRQDEKEDPLTEKGASQARALGAWWRVQRPVADCFYSSECVRASRTLELAFPGESYTQDSRLSEQDLGDFDRLEPAPITEAYKEYRKVYISDLDVVPPGGESVRQHQERVTAYLSGHWEEWLRGQKDVVVVCHGGTMRLVRMWVENIPDQEFSRFFNESADAMPNCQAILYSNTNPTTGESGENLGWTASFSPFPGGPSGYTWTRMQPDRMS
jgi:2,3-bisphosphoglycerate-dependent phosphoglycerate mutase